MTDHAQTSNRTVLAVLLASSVVCNIGLSLLLLNRGTQTTTKGNEAQIEPAPQGPAGTWLMDLDRTLSALDDKTARAMIEAGMFDMVPRDATPAHLRDVLSQMFGGGARLKLYLFSDNTYGSNESGFAGRWSFDGATSTVTLVSDQKDQFGQAKAKICPVRASNLELPGPNGDFPISLLFSREQTNTSP